MGHTSAPDQRQGHRGLWKVTEPRPGPAHSYCGDESAGPSILAPTAHRPRVGSTALGTTSPVGVCHQHVVAIAGEGAAALRGPHPGVLRGTHLAQGSLPQGYPPCPDRTDSYGAGTGKVGDTDFLLLKIPVNRAGALEAVLPGALAPRVGSVCAARLWVQDRILVWGSGLCCDLLCEDGQQRKSLVRVELASQAAFHKTR